MSGEDLEESGGGLILRNYPGICLEGLRKTRQNLSHDSRSPGQGLKLRLHEFEAGVLTTLPRLSLHFY
jgi:hypothetical protein